MGRDRIGTAAVLLLLAGLLPAGGASAQDAGTVARDRLPVLGTVGDLPPEAERVIVEITPAPTLRVGRTLVDLNGLKQVLQDRSRGLYEEAAPHASRLHVVLRVDRDTRWQDTQWVMQACADPAVRIHRILFAAVPEDGGAEGAMATFLPIDRGPPQGKDPPLLTSLPVRLRTEKPLSSAPGPALYAQLQKEWGGSQASHALSWASPVDADPSVSTGAVLQTVDTLLRWGVKVVFFKGTQLNKTGSLTDGSRFGPVVATPSVVLVGTPVAEPGAGAPVMPRLARVTGRMAGQTEPPGAMVIETTPIEEGAKVVEGPDVGVGGGAGGVFGGRRGGHRNLRVEGGAGTEAAVEGGLEWLKNHQSPGGFWDSDGFEAMCARNKCGGPGGPLYDPGVTGLALLAFLGYGETHKTPRYGAVVRNGLKYLKSMQDAEGCFGPRASKHFIYNHAIATLAMAEAYGLTQSPLFKANAQNGMNFAAECRNPYLGWRYGVKPQDNDTSVTGWMTAALYSGRAAGLDADPDAFEGVRNWLGKVTDPETGRTGYTLPGNGPARPQDMMDRFPPAKTESLTAIAVFTRILCGAEPDDPTVRKGADLCANCLPRWDERGGCIDLYYWYWGSQAMFQVGGESWEKWNGAMKKALIGGQRQEKTDDRFGSWDPVDPWAAEEGRVAATALCTMSLEAYYRYPRLRGMR